MMENVASFVLFWIGLKINQSTISGKFTTNMTNPKGMKNINIDVIDTI
ncbi:MAG: hypothetical protein ACW990_07090 [Promethearchaeota archaeon]